MTEYPRWKVGVGFSLCPAIGGALLAWYVAIVSDRSGLDPLGVAGVFLWVPVVFAIGGLIFFSVPAVLLAISYTFLKPKRGLGYLTTSLMGGLGAAAWALILGAQVSKVPVNEGFKSGDLTIFLLGAISSLLMALWVLPSESRDSN